jgi:hypothetical protein
MELSRKRFVLIIALCCILVGSTVGVSIWAYASGTISNANFEAGTQVETSSYTIWGEDSTYYAKNGSTGRVQYSGPNASNLINPIISSASSYITLVLKGNITLTNSIVVDNVDYLSINFDQITTDGDIHAFDIRNTSRWICIEGETIRFSGSTAVSTSVVLINSSQWCDIRITDIRCRSANHGIGVELIGGNPSFGCFFNTVHVASIIGALKAVVIRNIGTADVTCNEVTVGGIYASVANTGVTMNASNGAIHVGGNTISNTVYEGGGFVGSIGFWNNGRDNILLNCRAIDLSGVGSAVINYGDRLRLLGFGCEALLIHDYGNATTIIGLNGANNGFQYFLSRNEHPNTVGWTTNQTGAFWFDTTYNNFEYWNGTDCIYWNASGTGVQP